MRRSALIARAALAGAVFAATHSTAAAPVQLNVRIDQPGHRISPRLVGIFFEDINFGADGGLSAELVKNGSFEFPQSLMGWRQLQPEGGEGAVRVFRPSPSGKPPRRSHDAPRRGGIRNHQRKAEPLRMNDAVWSHPWPT